MSTTLTKRHFKALAIIVQNLPNNISKDLLISELKYWLKTTNPRFDAERFEKACKGLPFKK